MATISPKLPNGSGRTGWDDRCLIPVLLQIEQARAHLGADAKHRPALRTGVASSLEIGGSMP
jgi:hypothetical protein